jgi:hypothetical protein
MQQLAERRDEPHEDEPGADPDDKPGEDVVQEDSKSQADKDPADEGRPALGVAPSWVSSRSYGVHRKPPPRRSSPQEDVQHDRPDDRDEEHESDRDEYRHVVGLPRERSRDAIDAELGEPERTQPDDREDDRTYEQNLARRLHETRLPGSRCF